MIFIRLRKPLLSVLVCCVFCCERILDFVMCSFWVLIFILDTDKNIFVTVLTSCISNSSLVLKKTYFPEIVPP